MDALKYKPVGQKHFPFSSLNISGKAHSVQLLAYPIQDLQFGSQSFFYGIIN